VGDMMSKKTAYFLVGMSVLLWAYQPIVINLSLKEVPIFLMGTLRLGTAFIFLLIYKLIRKPESTAISRKKLAFDSVVFAIMLFTFSSLLLKAMSMEMTKSDNLIQFGIGPVFGILLLTIFNRSERESLWGTFKVVAVSLGLLGVYLITMNNYNIVTDFSSSSSIFYLAAIGVWALFSVLYRKNIENMDIHEGFVYITFIMFILYLLTSIKTGQLQEFSSLSFDEVATTILLALIVDVCCVFTYYRGLEKIESTKANMVLLMTPFISVVSSYVLLNQEINTVQIIGCIIVVIINIVMVSKDLIEDEKDPFM
jgi:drug/metabolite transporter (DMT)-like permease